jgi:hypothetical protein
MVLKGLGAYPTRTTPTARRVPNEYSGPVDAYEPGRALIPVQPVTCPAPWADSHGRPSAPFLAHLIATDNQEPQTRARRRAGAADATLAYALVLNKALAARKRT